MDRDFILGAIAAQMQTGVLVIGGDGRALYANPCFIESLGVAGAVEGRPVAEMIGNAALLAEVGSYLSGEAAGARDSGSEIEMTEGGGSYKVRFVPLKGQGDFCLLIFLREVTEEKRVETIKKDFVANVSHELRTPLASIKGYSETLLDGGMEDRETLREFLRIIDRHATRMSRLIDDLLTLSRLESHQMPIVSAPVDVKELIQSASTGFEKLARDKGINLSTRVPEGLPRIPGDRDRLEQVVVNLIDNAIKYTPSGGSVSVSAMSNPGAVCIEVRDTGIGIPAGDIPRIFERFYRVDKARSRELGGTGLGLAIVKHIIQAHNGRVNVESAPGRGSAFRCLFRTALDAAAAGSA